MPSSQRKLSQRKLSATLRILIADDDADVRQILGERLTMEGFETSFATSGEQALVQWLLSRKSGNLESSERPFDVLILDIQMPGMSGIETLKLVRQIDQEVTILMISGFGDLSRAVQSLRQGADDYISKPIRIWDLRDRIATARGRRRALEQRSNNAPPRTRSGETGKELMSGASPSTTARDTTTTGNTSGLEWGSWIRPRSSSENLDSADSPSPTDETMPQAAGPQAPDHRNALSKESSSRRRAEEQAAQHSPKGRENCSACSGAAKSGPGENPTSGSGKAADGKAPGREAPPSAQPASRLGDSAFSPGGSSAIQPNSPLDAFLLLATRMERQREGWRNHGQRVAQRCLCVVEGLATKHRFQGHHLRGLALAAKLHGLGLVQARGQSFREFSSFEHGTAPDDHELFSNLAQGQESENLELVAQVLSAYLRCDQAADWSKAKQKQAWQEQSQVIEVARRILHGTDTRRQQAQQSQPVPSAAMHRDDPINDLIQIFELSDHWIHLTSSGLEGLSPRHAHLRLSEALSHRSGFPWDRALQTLLNAS
ncbi:MAG: hypothetical protein CSA62_08090 [Planctomycetota bacterium]|nr:MAG: hypothetical protein CSA62_08090 [Planctomycetota bacterium]